LTYLAAFGLFYFLATRRLAHMPYARLTHWQWRDVEDILFAGVLGVVLGGRIGYCLFYQPAYYMAHPLEIAYVWQGGMSFHGGLLGVMAAMVWFAKTRHRPFFQVMDLWRPVCQRAWPLVASVISSMVNFGDAKPIRNCLGA
jgi:phosphatidylglycerol:prolipoprotein diacylglycerol transferase